MNYSETLDFLFSRLPAYHRIGKAAYKNNLQNTLALDEYFGHPHKKYSTIHVAGTNGKGSVSHMIASVLQEAGLKTGLYTSPHLRDFRERIRVNGEMISQEDVISFVAGHIKIIELITPSFFEMTVAMAFDYFSRAEVDIAVIEVGLGGRLDSTNIIRPVLSVITNIGHDHMDLLGNTLSAVATEKAGIIKGGVPVVISESQDETKDVFKTYASSCGTDIFFADERFECRLEPFAINNNTRVYNISDRKTGIQTEGTTPLGGDYQSSNLIAVFEVFDKLRKSFVLTEKDLIHGIANVSVNTGLMGRWQILGTKPLVICDTGHNKEGLTSVLNQLKSIDSSGLHMVIGFVNDKDLDSVLPLFPAGAKYYFVRASIERALDSEILKSRAEYFGLLGESFPDVEKGLETAVKNAGPDDIVFIGGSTFVVAEII